MDKKRILYITSELMPYFEESELSRASMEFPKKMQDEGHEVRIFMPKFGVINERRHQLHEVIRLSGMNIVVNDVDQPLIIKVASIPEAKLQVYFIDNEEYFRRKFTYGKEEGGEWFDDNDERIIFFSRGVIEAIKKLNWMPDVIHIQSWFGALMPLYLKTLYEKDPLFTNTKIIYSVFNSFGEKKLSSENVIEKIEFDGVKIEESILKSLKNPSVKDLHRVAINFSEGIVIHKDCDYLIEAEDAEKKKLVYEDLEEAKEALLEFYSC